MARKVLSGSKFYRQSNLANEKAALRAAIMIIIYFAFLGSTFLYTKKNTIISIAHTAVSM